MAPNHFQRLALLRHISSICTRARIWVHGNGRRRSSITPRGGSTADRRLRAARGQSTVVSFLENCRPIIHRGQITVPAIGVVPFHSVTRSRRSRPIETVRDRHDAGGPPESRPFDPSFVARFRWRFRFSGFTSLTRGNGWKVVTIGAPTYNRSAMHAVAVIQLSLSRGRDNCFEIKDNFNLSIWA